MQQIIAEVLPPAITILVSPFGVVGLILILLSKRPKSNGITYTLGWAGGATVVFVLTMLLGGSVAAPSDGSSTVKDVITIVLAVGLIALAVKEFMAAKNSKGGTPKWFSMISSMKPLMAFGLGALLSGINPKNLLAAAAAGVGVGALSVSAADQTLATIIFAIVVSLAVLVIFVAFLIGGKRLKKPLDTMRDWLIKHNSVIVGAILLLMGLNLILKLFTS